MTKVINEFTGLEVDLRFRDPEDWEDDAYTLAEFLECVECGGFIDYDGHGSLMKDGKVSNVTIYPSNIKAKLYQYQWADGVMWYNK